MSGAGRAALAAALREGEDMSLRLEWSIMRDAPLESSHGGPMCEGVQEARLAGATRSQLLQVLQVRSRRGYLRLPLRTLRAFATCIAFVVCAFAI